MAIIKDQIHGGTSDRKDKVIDQIDRTQWTSTLI